MAVTTVTYAASDTISMDLSNLGSSATFISGVESEQIDNTTNKYVDAIVHGRFIVGTTPTLPCSLNIYVWGADVSLGTTALGVLDGTTSAESLVNSTYLGSALRFAASVSILVNTSDTTYDVAPFTVAQLFGGVMPQFWGLYVAHNMTAALKTDAGNTDEFRFTGITYTTA
jgi:hypothetical protein